MIENHKYQLSPIKLYLPFMMFLGTILLLESKNCSIINRKYYYCWNLFTHFSNSNCSQKFN